MSQVERDEYLDELARDFAWEDIEASAVIIEGSDDESEN